MKIKLIKLQDKFILVNDEDLQVNDYFLVGDAIEQCLSSSELDDLSIGKQYPKVIAGIPELPSIDFSLLSEADCKIIGWVDVEKLAEKYARKQCDDLYDTESITGGSWGWETSLDFTEGFKTAQSFNGKMFSLEDMIDFSEKCLVIANETDNIGRLRRFISKQAESIQQKSWDVEVEMNTWFKNGHDSEIVPTTPKITNNSIKIVKICNTN